MTQVTKKFISIEILCCTAHEAMSMINKLNETNIFSTFGRSSGSASIKMHTTQIENENDLSPYTEIDSFEKSDVKIEIVNGKVIHKIMSKL